MAWLTNAYDKVKNEFVNPQSRLRGDYIPAIGKALTPLSVQERFEQQINDAVTIRVKDLQQKKARSIIQTTLVNENIERIAMSVIRQNVKLESQTYSWVTHLSDEYTIGINFQVKTDQDGTSVTQNDGDTIYPCKIKFNDIIELGLKAGEEDKSIIFITNKTYNLLPKEYLPNLRAQRAHSD